MPFLDKLVTKSDDKFITSVYRKPTFTGQHIYWNSHGPKQRKTNLIDTLTHRALKICSKSTLKHELDNIRSILVQNGYPEFLIDSRISKKLLRFQQSTKEGPKKCSVYLKLPWIGENFLKFEKKNYLLIFVLERSNHEWFFPPNEFYLQYIKTFFPLFNKVTSYMNTCATATASTWVERLNVCRTESASMYRSLFKIEQVKNVNNQNAQEN